MKTIIVLLTFFFAGTMLAQDVITISGQPERVETIKTILSHGLRAQGKTADFVTHYNDGYMKKGEYTQIELNYQKRYIQLSNSMLRKVQKEFGKADSDVSFSEITKALCKDQGDTVMDICDDVSSTNSQVFIAGDLSGVEASLANNTSRLDRIENNQAGLADDHRVINDNLKVIDQKLDRNFNETVRQGKKTRSTIIWTAVLQTLVDEGTDYAYHQIEMNQMKKGKQVDIFNYNTYKTYRTTNNTTTINNNGGNTGGTITPPDHNTNGRGVQSFL